MSDQTTSEPTDAAVRQFVKERVKWLEGSDADPDEEFRRMTEEATLEESALRLPKGYLSVSQVTQYLRCPRQYEFRTVKGLVRPPSVALAEGKALHRGLEIGHREALKSGKAPLDVMLDAHRDSWVQIKSEVDWKAEGNDENEDLILGRSRTFLTLYHDDWLPNLQAMVDRTGPWIERRFWAVVTPDKIPMLGYIDLIAEDHDPKTTTVGPAVVDHKTLSRSKTEEDLKTDLQLSVYAHVAAVSAIRFQMFIKNKVPVIKALSGVRTEKDWSWAEFVIHSAAKGIAAGYFPPGAPGWHCSPKFCGYFSECHSGIVHV